MSLRVRGSVVSGREFLGDGTRSGPRDGGARRGYIDIEVGRFNKHIDYCSRVPLFQKRGKHPAFLNYFT